MRPWYPVRAWRINSPNTYRPSGPQTHEPGAGPAVDRPNGPNDLGDPGIEPQTRRDLVGQHGPAVVGMVALAGDDPEEYPARTLPSPQRLVDGAQRLFERATVQVERKIDRNFAAAGEVASDFGRALRGSAAVLARGGCLRRWDSMSARCSSVRTGTDRAPGFFLMSGVRSTRPRPPAIRDRSGRPNRRAA